MRFDACFVAAPDRFVRSVLKALAITISSQSCRPVVMNVRDYDCLCWRCQTFPSVFFTFSMTDAIGMLTDPLPLATTLTPIASPFLLNSGPPELPG